MGASNTTPTLDLPLFSDNDRPTWRGDVNDAMSKIDTAHTSQAAAIQDLVNKDLDTYSKAQTDALLTPKATTAAMTAALALKADSAATTTALGLKADTSSVNAGLALKVAKGELVYNVKDYGAAGDGVADDTSEIQACFDAAPASAIVFFPAGTYKITAEISITKAVQVWGGSQYHTFVLASGCNAFVTASGLGDVRFNNLAIHQNVLYTTTTNLFIGIKVNGTNAARPGYHVYQDVWIKGFETAIQTNYLWTSEFRNIHTSHGLVGFDVYGLSENNHVIGGNIVVGVGTQTRLTGSSCVRLNGQVSRSDTTSIVSEGWIIQGTLMYGGDYGVLAQGYGNYQIANCILDAIQISGVKVANLSTAYGSHALIDGLYIAFAANAVTTEAAVEINNTVAGTRGTRVRNCDILAYAGANAPYGIRTNASASAQVVASGNVFSGFNVADIYLQSSNNVITGNRCVSALTAPTNYNIESVSGQLNLVSDNYGTVRVISPNFPNTYAMGAGGVKHCRGTGVPTALAWNVGDRIANSAPAVAASKGWVCTVAGTPGTWVSEGNL